MALQLGGKFNTTGTVFRPNTDKFGNPTCTLSTGRKKGKDSDEYINSNWLTKFVGQAKEKAKDLTERDRIVILSAQVDSVFNKETGKTFTGITIFDFEMAEGFKQTATKKEVTSDDEFPF